MILEDIKAAIAILQKGDVLAFPTETVYGLGGLAHNYESCAKIYQLKERPAHNPLIVHVATIDQALELGDFSDTALKLTEFWPGPLTIVVKLRKNSPIAHNVLAGLDTIALRMPNHQTALEIIKATGPIAAPSANKSGYISATNAKQVEEDFDGQIHVLTGSITYGIESTIVKAYNDVCILRHGFITSQAIESVIKVPLLINKSIGIEAPGQLLKHYAPKTLVKLNNLDFDNINSVFLTFGDHQQLSSNQIFLNLSPTSNLLQAAANLYTYLRGLDKIALKNNLKYISISPIPNIDIGIAINDRILRASANM